MQRWRGMTVFFSSLLTIVICITALASSYTSEINGFMGVSSVEVVNNGGETGEELERYRSRYDSIDEMMQAKSELCEALTDEGIVMAKNNGVLPLTDARNLTCMGKASVDLIYGGGSGAGIIGNEGTGINATLKEGLERAGYTVNPKLWDFYLNSSYKSSYGGTGGDAFTVGEVPVSEYPEDTGYDGYADACIVTLARNAGESADAPAGGYTDGEVFYQLSEYEKEMIAEAKENFDKVIVLVNSPSPLSIDELEKDEEIDAILIAGGLGMNGTYSIGKILNGEVNPSGRLADTYAADSLSSPAMQNFGDYAYTNAAEITEASNNGASEENTKYLVQSEGIYIGYKYYETRYEDCVLGQGNASSDTGAFASEGGWNYADEVTYSFGHGLSYTEFEQKLKSVNVEEDVITAEVEVTNTGDTAGKDVVQFYVQSPYTQYDRENQVEKPALQLVNFGKTELLKPGETENLTLKMDLYNLCSYDAYEAKTWILDKGDYYFAIGEDVHQALNHILAAKGKTAKDGMDADGDESFTVKWENPKFRTFENPEFSEKGFTTYADTWHNTTGNAVENQLACMDLNTWVENGVTYLSRADWEGTWPESYEELEATEEMVKHLLAEIYEPGESDTSSVTTGADTDYQVSMMIGKSYDDPDWELILDQMTLDDMTALVGENFSATSAIENISYPGTIENDGPSGIVTNYSAKYDHGSTIFEGIETYSSINPRMYPSESLVAAAFSQKLVYELGKMFGEDSLYTEQAAIWAPGLNLHRTPYSGRNFEYFSEDSMMTYIFGAQQAAGMQSNGTIACPKHFAFNDYETNRFGLSTFMNEQTARENGLRGFEGAVAVGKCHNIMTTLSRVGCDWIGMNTEAQDNILRSEWGFDGYVITDNAIKPYMYGTAVHYGTDKFLVFIPGRYQEQLAPEVVSKDLKLLKALRESCHRILYVNINSNRMNGISSDITLKKVAPFWKNILMTVNAVLAVLSILSLAVFLQRRKNYRKVREEKENE